MQHAILECLWSSHPASAEEIREALHARYPLKDSSVRTLLRRLEARGYLTHTVEGKRFVYRPVTESRSVAASAVQQLIDRFWGGSVEQFLVGMVDEEVLSARELKRLASKVKKRQ